MRNAIALAALVATVGCTPDIGGGTYFCGPERLCPDGLVCDEPVFICEVPTAARPFTCPDGANASEPDNELDSAVDLGKLQCGTDRPLNNYDGCIDSDSDVDLFKFEYDAECSGQDPQVSLSVRYPFAFAAIEIDLLDDAGAVIQSAELCTPPGDFTGSEVLCLDARLDSGTYYFRFSTPAETANCDGDCHYNLFVANLTLPLS